MYAGFVILFPLTQYYLWSQIDHFFTIRNFYFLRISFWWKWLLIPFVRTGRLLVCVTFLMLVITYYFRQICSLNSIVGIQNGYFILLLPLYFIEIALFQRRRCFSDVPCWWKVSVISELTSRIIFQLLLLRDFIFVENWLFFLFFYTVLYYNIAYFFLRLFGVKRFSHYWRWTRWILCGPFLFPRFHHLILGLWIIRISDRVVSFWDLGSFLFD